MGFLNPGKHNPIIKQTAELTLPRKGSLHGLAFFDNNKENNQILWGYYMLFSKVRRANWEKGVR